MSHNVSLIAFGKTSTRRSVVKNATCAILLLLSSMSDAASTHHCSNIARDQAKKLLRFHFGSDDRIEIDKNVKILAPITNPANTKQLFDVLEVWGYVYKGQYRMRFIYARVPAKCILIGEEVLEYASL